jgi:uncharacterized membrane protein YdbT with pleckstrin-like domain
MTTTAEDAEFDSMVRAMPLTYRPTAYLYVTPVFYSLVLISIGIVALAFPGLTYGLINPFIPAACFFLFAVILMVRVSMERRTTYLVVEQNRLIHHSGIMMHETQTILLSQIVSVDVFQNLGSGAFRVGSLIVTTTGNERMVFPHLERVQEVAYLTNKLIQHLSRNN